MNQLPSDMQLAIAKLKKSKDKEDCLRKAYEILAKKYYGNRLKTYIRFFELFNTNIEKAWNKDGFLHCTMLNRLLRILLVKSGFFRDSDIKTRWTSVWYFSPHQYLEVMLADDELVKIDVWANAYGIGFGDYAHGFH